MSKLVTLKDLGPLFEEVEIRKKKIRVKGIGVDDLFWLMLKYPDLRKLLDDEKIKITAAQLMRLGPPLIGDIIAAAVTERQDYDEEAAWIDEVQDAAKRARKLSGPEQLRILAALLRVMFADGFGPFVEDLTALRGFLGSAAEESGISSPSGISAALVGEFRQPSLGNSRRDN